MSAFARYCRKYSRRFWEAQETQLAHVLETWLPESPRTWSYFVLTGAPYRAYLFVAGERTKYWIVYRIDEQTRTVHIVRMWNAARNPRLFRV